MGIYRMAGLCALLGVIGGAIMAGWAGSAVASAVGWGLLGAALGFAGCQRLGVAGGGLGAVGGALLGAGLGSWRVYENAPDASRITAAITVAIAMGLLGAMLGAVAASVGAAFAKDGGGAGRVPASGARDAGRHGRGRVKSRKRARR